MMLFFKFPFINWCTEELTIYKTRSAIFPWTTLKSQCMMSHDSCCCATLKPPPPPSHPSIFGIFSAFRSAWWLPHQRSDRNKHSAASWTQRASAQVLLKSFKRSHFPRPLNHSHLPLTAAQAWAVCADCGVIYKEWKVNTHPPPPPKVS